VYSTKNTKKKSKQQKLCYSAHEKVSFIHSSFIIKLTQKIKKSKQCVAVDDVRVCEGRQKKRGKKKMHNTKRERVTRFGQTILF